VTGRTALIHPKGGTPYTVKNNCHWMHFTNDATYCPVFEGDTRIVMTCVPKLINKIPTEQLREGLHNEAPAFMYTLLNKHLPPADNRLYLPILDTQVKQSTLEAKKSPFEQFCQDCVFEVDGGLTNTSHLYDTASNWIKEHFGVADADYWTQRRMQQSIPMHWVKGLNGIERKTYFANITLEENLEPTGRWVKAPKGKELVKLPG
jgi:hypothetical protein